MGPDRTRPPGIWIIVGLQLVITALWVGDLALRTELSGDGFQALVASSDVLRALLIAWAGGVVLASILLIRLSRRGWALMMVLVGMSLAANLVFWWAHPERAQWVSMAISVLVTFYLNSAAVRRRFLVRHEVSRLTIADGPHR